MKALFLSIIDKGVKDNTYKFALAKFLLDFAHDNSLSKNLTISYREIAEKFLEYYWYQECKYKLKQDFKTNRLPVILSIIRHYCGTDYIHQSYEKYFENHQEIKEAMIIEIEKWCLQDVIPRFQPRDDFRIYKHYHEISPTGKKFRLPSKENRYIELNLDAHHFLKDNYHELSKILIYAWAKFLEKTNFTPRLIAKIEDLGHHKRRSLQKFKEVLLRQAGPVCFYCNEHVEGTQIHIDHFIPWSYVYDDALWNLVVSCSDCNLKKSDYLPPETCIQKIEYRNQKFKLNEYKKDLYEYYDNCKKAGFLTIESISCSSD